MEYSVTLIQLQLVVCLLFSPQMNSHLNSVILCRVITCVCHYLCVLVGTANRLITHMQIRFNAIRNGFWGGFNMTIEPRHDKMICAPSEDSDQPGHPPSPAQSDQSLHCPPEAKPGPKLPIERKQRL